MTLSSAYVELFIGGKSPGENVRGMSGYHIIYVYMIYNQIHGIYIFAQGNIHLEQRFTTCGPRAKSGPPASKSGPPPLKQIGIFLFK